MLWNPSNPVHKFQGNFGGEYANIPGTHAICIVLLHLRELPWRIALATTVPGLMQPENACQRRVLGSFWLKL